MTPRRKDVSMLLAVHCMDAAQVTNIIALRLRPQVLEPNEILPAATYEIVSSEHFHHLQGAQGEVQTRVQFNCYALSCETANKAAYAIRDVLDGLTGLLEVVDLEAALIFDCVVDNNYQRREPDAPGSAQWRYRTVIDFVVTHSEPVPTLVLE